MRLLFLFSLVSMLAACSPKFVPVNSALVEEKQWEARQWQGVVVYLSQDLQVERPIRPNHPEPVLGEVVVLDGRSSERLHFRSMTPGIVTHFLRDGKLGVVFGEDGAERYLIFAPHPRRQGLYTLHTGNWQDGRAQVNYGGQTYFTIPGKGIPVLQVPAKSLRP